MGGHKTRQCICLCEQAHFGFESCGGFVTIVIFLYLIKEGVSGNMQHGAQWKQFGLLPAGRKNKKLCWLRQASLGGQYYRGKADDFEVCLYYVA